MATQKNNRPKNINDLELQPVLASYEELKKARDNAMAEYRCLPEGEARNLLGKKIAAINLQIAGIKQRLYQVRHGEQDINFFRRVAYELLPKKVYHQLLEEARKQLRDKEYKPLEKIDLFSDEEYALLEKAKKHETDCKALQQKITKAKAAIDAVRPNMIGVSDNDEYTRRLAIIKMLTKIMKEL